MLDQVLIVVHFLGLAMGFSSGFANMVMAGVIAKAAPDEQRVLARFAPAMSGVGALGLAMLWASGIAIVMTRVGTFAILPQPFVVKLIAVVLLTVVVGYIHLLMPKAQRGDAAAMARIHTRGKITGPLALIAVIFAVITFG